MYFVGLSLEESSEGATSSGGSCLLGEDFASIGKSIKTVGNRVFNKCMPFELLGVLLPLGIDRDVLVHLLMADEEVTVSPFARRKVAFGNNFSDLLLNASKLFGLVRSKDFIKKLARSDFLKIISKGAVIFVLELIMESLTSLES